MRSARSHFTTRRRVLRSDPGPAPPHSEGSARLSPHFLDISTSLNCELTTMLSATIIILLLTVLVATDEIDPRDQSLAAPAVCALSANSRGLILVRSI